MSKNIVEPMEWQVLTQEEKTLLRTLVAMSAVQLDRGLTTSLQDEVGCYVGVVIACYNELKEKTQAPLVLDTLKSMLLKGGLVGRNVLDYKGAILSTSWIKEFVLTKDELSFQLGSNVPDFEDWKE